MALVAVLLVGCGGPSDSSLTRILDVRSKRWIKMGNYDVIAHPTYADALRVLGRSTSCALTDRETADAKWTKLGMELHLETLASIPQGRNACTLPGSVYIATVMITGRKWRTVRGLHIGDSVSRLRRLYPHATFAPAFGRRAWWLVTDIGYVPTRARYPVLLGIATAGRLGAFRVEVGAQGE
jgi:hypothetical protein